MNTGDLQLNAWGLMWNGVFFFFLIIKGHLQERGGQFLFGLLLEKHWNANYIAKFFFLFKYSKWIWLVFSHIFI